MGDSHSVKSQPDNPITQILGFFADIVAKVSLPIFIPVIKGVEGSVGLLSPVFDRMDRCAEKSGFHLLLSDRDWETQPAGPEDVKLDGLAPSWRATVAASRTVTYSGRHGVIQLA